MNNHITFNKTSKRILGLKPKSWALIAIIILINLSLFTIAVKVQADSIPENYVGSPKAVEVPLTSEQEQIRQYIREVFGKYSGKAFLLLSCENHALNPFAVHDNERWGQGIGQDYGIFQINNHWQGVSNTHFLTDWKTNIDMAFVIFKNSGYNFHLWACGERFGI